MSGVSACGTKVCSYWIIGEEIGSSCRSTVPLCLHHKYPPYNYRFIWDIIVYTTEQLLQGFHTDYEDSTIFLRLYANICYCLYILFCASHSIASSWQNGEVIVLLIFFVLAVIAQLCFSSQETLLPVDPLAVIGSETLIANKNKM